VAIGHPRTASGADGIVVFLAEPRVGNDGQLQHLPQRLRQRLPPWMQPQEIIAVPSFPLNANGKVDRGALLAQLQARAPVLASTGRPASQVVPGNGP
jgi:acyl-coenzyme A synthetase/AMP-(fatty) acid ligase